MKFTRLVCCAALVLCGTTASAAVHRVMPGESIQAAVDAASPGDTVKVWPGDYTETHGGSAAVRITKPLKLIAKSKIKDGVRVRILPGPGNTDGIVIAPVDPNTDPDVERVVVKGFTVEGFSNNGIWLRHVKRFKVYGNESIDNLENGIWPTLSANGLVKKNASYGSLDSAMWIEASENVRVIKNDLSFSPTGLEVTVSKNILMKKNDIHNNTVGVGLYHPNAAGLAPLGGDGDWVLVNNHIHDNNEVNTAPAGSLSADLPPGGGLLVLAVDRVTARRNLIENNDFFGIAVVDWCLAFDCGVSPANPKGEEGDQYPDDNKFEHNDLLNNAANPVPFSGLELFAADITYLTLDLGHANCFAKNTPGATTGFIVPPIFAKNCN